MDAWSLWPSRPQPFADESFASWFIRLAHANGLPPKDLYRAAMPGAYLHSLDLDRLGSPQLFQMLEEKTGVDATRIQSLTLATWQGKLFETDEGLNKLLWLPPVGREVSKKSFGQQVCPRCLDEGPPYFRKFWRLSFVTACPRHGVLLVDRCRKCGSPIAPARGLDARGRLRCFRCEADFADGTAEPLWRDGDLAVQDALLRTAHDGWLELGGYGPVHSLAAFQILMLLFRLLATGRPALALRTWLAGRVDFPTAAPATIPRIKEVELLNPRCRQELVRLALYLIGGWPNRFVEAARAVGLSTRDLIRGPVPFAYWHAVTTHLADPIRAYGEEEAKAARACLERRGETPHYHALVRLTGTKITARRDIAVPAGSHVPYGQGRFWKLDGVSPEVREAVKQAARLEGENVASWVERALRAELGTKSAMISPYSAPNVVARPTSGVGDAGPSDTA